MSIRTSIVTTTLPMLLAMGLGPMTGQAWAQATSAGRPRPEPTMASYRRSMVAWMPRAAQRRFPAAALPRTEPENLAALSWDAADFAARFSAAWALTAIDQHGSSARLRGLAPVTDRVTARDSLRQLQNILWRLERQPRGWQARNIDAAFASLTAARDAVEHALEANGEPVLADLASRPALSAIEHARLALRSSATAATEAVHAGASQERMIDGCIQHLRTMAERAR